MANIFLDLESGNDANDGTSFANRVKTLTRASNLALVAARSGRRSHVWFLVHSDPGWERRRRRSRSVLFDVVNESSRLL